MKLAFFDDFKLGVVKGDNIVDVTAAVADVPRTGPGDLLSGVIARWDACKPKIEAAAAASAGVPLSDVRIRPPVPKPGNIVCMAVNYMETRSTKPRRRSSGRATPCSCRTSPRPSSRARPSSRS